MYYKVSQRKTSQLKHIMTMSWYAVVFIFALIGFLYVGGLLYMAIHILTL